MLDRRNERVEQRLGRDRMKSTRVNGTAHAAMDSRAAMDPHAAMATHAGVSAALAGAAQSGAVDSSADSVPYRLQQALAELGELKRALATSQEESNGARRQIDVLMDTISGLRQKVIRLEQEVAKVHHFAYHDELTGLPNRSLLRDRLNQAMVQAARQHKQVGLLLLDLDGFKSVNDRLGHATGDKLQTPATRGGAPALLHPRRGHGLSLWRRRVRHPAARGRR